MEGSNLKPIFSVFRSSMIGRSGVSVETYENTGEEYHTEGSFAQRSCTFYVTKTRQIMAEIQRKVDAPSNVILGKTVFSLIIKPGFDAAFTMGLVMVLDQISSDGLVDTITGFDPDDSNINSLDSISPKIGPIDVTLL